MSLGSSLLAVLAVLTACAEPAPRPVAVPPPAPAPAVASEPTPDAGIAVPPVNARRAPSADPNPPAHHAAWPITSPCVDVSEDVDRRLKGKPLLEVYRWDLDLDGEFDWVIVTDSLPEKGRSKGWVYLARGLCGHFAAEWSGSIPQPAGEGKILLVEEPCKEPVVSIAKERCCPKAMYWRYVWDGKSMYRRRDSFTEPHPCHPEPF